MPMCEEAVWDRFESAEVRGRELVNLNGGDLGGADVKVRARLSQEFFFHLVGAIEFVAQLAAEQRLVGTPDAVSISTIADRLQGDSLEQPLRDLYVNPRTGQFPRDPYADRGYLWRIYNYRHQVTHRGANPFNFHQALVTSAFSGGSADAQQASAHFLLDPLDVSRGPSVRPIPDEIIAMLDVVRRRVTTALAAI